MSFKRLKETFTRTLEPTSSLSSRSTDIDIQQTVLLTNGQESLVEARVKRCSATTVGTQLVKSSPTFTPTYLRAESQNWLTKIMISGPRASTRNLTRMSSLIRSYLQLLACKSMDTSTTQSSAKKKTAISISICMDAVHCHDTWGYTDEFYATN